jgi:erythromycin esterase-like protein
MASMAADEVLERLGEIVHPLKDRESDYEPLLQSLGDAKFVLLGEATHGTHEFYKARTEITKHLIEEKGFNVVAWEADWPHTLRVNRFIRGRGPDRTALEALSDFTRFPSWMWRNRDVLGFVEWLRAHNQRLPASQPKVGVYGLDLYSLHASIQSVIDYLEDHEPVLAKEAKQRYGCFEEFGEDPQHYGMIAGLNRSLSCEEQVVQQLLELQHRSAELLRQDGKLAEDELFFATQNAAVAKDAEEYYRAMYRGRPNTWNLRDKHMVETLDRLMEHFQTQGEHPKAVVWAHNSHLGDARATSMVMRGEWNVGQLVREWHDAEAFLVGFSTFQGSVTAASDWGDPAERKTVRPGLQGSYERLFHGVHVPNFLLNFEAQSGKRIPLPSELLERAIGVIYRPETERMSHYFFARMAEQFDAVIHFDETHAVEPLERTSEWDRGEFPDTYPSAM